MTQLTIFNRDAREAFLRPESIDLFLIHPPYFNGPQNDSDSNEGQLDVASDRNFFIGSILQIIKNMSVALKPTGSIFVGLPTDTNFYKIIEKISLETDLQFGPMFYWDFTNSTRVKEIRGVENNIFLNLHKGQQQENPDYNLDSYTLVHPWEMSEFLKSKSYLGAVHHSAPEIVYERIIGKYSKPGDTVADVMGGTGTVLRIAKRMGRNVVYNDISAEQVEIAKSVINDQEKEMDLKRNEVIDLMTKEIQDMNRALMSNMNIPHEQQEQYIIQSKDELTSVNGMLFDLLVRHGVIR